MPEYPQGKYRATIESQGFDRNTNGKEYFGLVIRPTAHFADGLSGGEEEFVNNPFPRTINFWLTTEKAIAFSRKKIMHATGWDGSRWKDLDPATANHFNTVGLEIEVVNNHSQGTSNPEKTYDNFDVQLPREAKLNNDSGIAQRVDRLVGTWPEPNGGTPDPPPAPAVAPAPAADDEVPF